MSCEKYKLKETQLIQERLRSGLFTRVLVFTVVFHKQSAGLPFQYPFWALHTHTHILRPVLLLRSSPFAGPFNYGLPWGYRDRFCRVLCSILTIIRTTHLPSSPHPYEWKAHAQRHIHTHIHHTGTHLWLLARINVTKVMQTVRRMDCTLNGIKFHLEETNFLLLQYTKMYNMKCSLCQRMTHNAGSKQRIKTKQKGKSKSIIRVVEWG